jgi:hypothetical protein
VAEFGAGLLALLKAGLLVLVVTSAGMRLCRGLDPDERPVAGFAVGMALLSTLATLLLLARLPAAWILGGTLLGASLWTLRELAESARRAAGWIRGRIAARGGELAFGVAVAVVGAFGIVGCWAPATGWDTGVYHFALARLRAQEGWLVVRPDIPFSAFPAGMESLYTAGFLFDGERLASLINFSFYFAGLGLVRVWATRAGGERARTWAGMAYLTSITYLLRLDGGDVEVGQAVSLGLGLYAMWRIREGGMATGRWVVGVSFGFALAVKFSMAWAVLAAGIVWILLGWRDRRPARELVRDFLVVGLVSFSVSSPCYLRNGVVEGNPVYPLLDPALGAVMRSGDGGLAGWKGVLSAFRFDGLVIAALPAAFSSARLRWLGAPALLLLIPVGLHTGLSDAGLSNAVRFVSPAFLPLWVLIGVAAATWARWPAALIVGSALALSLGVHVERNRRKIPVAVGRQARDAYLEQRISSYWALRRAESELPPGRKVLLIEQRSYYCRVPFVQAADVQRHVDFASVSSSASFRELLDRHSIGLIVYSHAPEAKTRTFGDLLARLPSVLETTGVVALETRNACTLYRVP